MAMLLLAGLPGVAQAQVVDEAPVPAIDAGGGGIFGDWRDVFIDVPLVDAPADGDAPVASIRTLFFETLLPQFEYIFAFVALLIWVIYLFVLIGNAGNEEIINTQRKNLGWGVIGFLLIALAVDIGNAFAPTNENQDMINPDGVESIFVRLASYISLALAPIAIATVFYGGFRFITANGDEESISGAKKIFLYGFGGLLVAMFAEPIVTTVVYTEDRTPGDEEVANFAAQLVGLLQFVLAFLGVLSMASFIVAGGYYLTTFGDEDRSRKAREIIGGSLLGIVIILSAYALVSLFNPAGA